MYVVSGYMYVCIYVYLNKKKENIDKIDCIALSRLQRCN